MGYPQPAQTACSMLPFKFGEPSSVSYSFPTHYPRHLRPAPRSAAMAPPTHWRTTSSTRAYMHLPPLAAVNGPARSHPQYMLSNMHSESRPSNRTRPNAAEQATTSPTRSDSSMSIHSESSPPAVHVICTAPLIAPKPLPYHSPTFLQFDLPDDDEDLSHPPYVSRPHKRKRQDDDDDDDDADEPAVMKRRATDDRRGRWHGHSGAVPLHSVTLQSSLQSHPYPMAPPPAFAHSYR